ncbi:MAG: hypothetical protein HY689_00890 [Chloroflexi bacterium]|nr:hypothetical protein [Chloroflexota bacterium]
MVAELSILVALIHLVNRIPVVLRPRQGRGRPQGYSDRLFLKVLVIMVVHRLAKVHTVLTVLEQPTPEMQRPPDAPARERALPQPADLRAAPAG